MFRMLRNAIFILQILLANADGVEGNKLSKLNGCCTSESKCEKWIDSWNSDKERNRNSSIWFQIQPQDRKSCNLGDTTKINFNVFEYQQQNKSILVDGFDSISGENYHLFFEDFGKDGFKLRIQSDSQPSLEISKSAHCLRNTIQSEKNGQWDAQIEICHSRNKGTYRKCCPEGQGLFMNFTDWHCTSLHEESHKLTKQFPPYTRDSWQFGQERKITPFIGIPSCEDGKFHNFRSTSLLGLDYPRIPYLLSNDKIKYQKQFSKNGISSWTVEVVAAEEYCVDKVVLPEEFIDKTCANEQDALIFCESHKNANINSQLSSETIQTYRFLYVACLLLAILFLGATAIGQILLKEIRNIHTWTVQSYVLSQLFFYIFLVIIYLDQQLSFLSQNFCIFVGVTAHFFSISTFSYLSVINFDLWWTFRVLQPSNQTNMPWTKLVWYAIFATALPLFIVGGTLFWHFYSEKEVMCRSTFETASGSLPTPGYGKDLCFLTNSAQLTYFYLPVGILLLANLIFYSCTSYRLCSLYKKSQNASLKKHRQSCQLLLKLFFVMGTVWIFQCLHAAIEPHERKWYWTITDILGFLQAVAIFVIFMCKRETLRAIQIKYPSFSGACCRFEGLYRRPTITDRSTDGSTKISRADCQRKSVIGQPQNEWQEPSEIIQLPTVDLISLSSN